MIGSFRQKRLRLKILLGAGALVIAGVLFYVEFWQRRPMGTGPALIPVDAPPLSETWREGPVLLLGLGDSITDGLGSTAGKSYFDRLVKSPKDEFPDMQGVCLTAYLPQLKTQNSALSGTTSIELLQFSLPRIEVQDPDVFGIVVLTTGGNDVIHHYGRTPPREGAMYGATLEQARPWIQNYRERLARILDEINLRFPGGCDIFLANIYDPTDGMGDIVHTGLPPWPEGVQVLAAYNDVIAETCAARDNVHFIDIHSAFLGHGIHCRQFWRPTYQARDPHYWYWDNLEDPNDRGYDAIRRLYFNSISQVMRSKHEANISSAQK